MYSFAVLVEAVRGFAAPPNGGGILVSWETKHAMPENGHSRVVIPDAEKTALFRQGFRFASIVEETTRLLLVVIDANKRAEIGFMVINLQAHLPETKGEMSRMRCKIPLAGADAEGVIVDLGIECLEFVPPAEEPAREPWDGRREPLLKKIREHP